MGCPGTPDRRPRSLGSKPGVEDSSQRVALKLAGKEVDKRAIEEPKGKAVSRYGPGEGTVIRRARDDPAFKPVWLVSELEHSRAGSLILEVSGIPASQESGRSDADLAMAPYRAEGNSPRPVTPDVVIVSHQRVAL